MSVTKNGFLSLFVDIILSNDVTASWLTLHVGKTYKN